MHPLRTAHIRLFSTSLTCIAGFALLLLMSASAPGFAQDVNQDAKPAAVQAAPVKHIHVMRPASVFPDASAPRLHSALRVAQPNQVRANNTGSGVVYTCDPNVAVATCTYLNTTIAGYYNSTFTNANANIYIQYGTTGLGESEGYLNLVTYSQYQTALTNNANKSPVQTAALSAMNTYDAKPYASGNLGVTVALGTALGFTGLTGITPTEGACTPGTSGCYNEIVTVINDPQDYGFSLYYDNLGGAEPANAYDFYAVVEHETDEVLGTASCITTQTDPLSDECDFDGGNGVPSAVDLFRYSSPGVLALDSSPSTSAGQYFSYNGGVDYGAYGLAEEPKIYNTLDNGDDFADYLSSSPDCGTNEAIQDAEGCPGEDAGLTILNDGQSEITILNAVGFNVPVTQVAATMASPTPGTTLAGTSVKFTWNAATGNPAGYFLYLGTTGVGSKNLYASSETTATSVTVSGLPTNGATIYARVSTSFNGTLVNNDYIYTAAKAATLTTPAPSTTLAGPSVKFTWTAATGTPAGYWLFLGTTGVGSKNLFDSNETTATSATFNGLPTNGATIYARVYTSYNGTLVYSDYTYAAAAQAILTSPTPSSTLAGPSVKFTWSAATGGSAGYWLFLGTTGAGSKNLFDSNQTTATTATFSSLPTNGATIYARIYTSYNGTLVYADYTYAAAKAAVLLTPTPGSTLTSSPVKFTWSAATGASAGYWLFLGTSVGSKSLFDSNETTATSATFSGTLPTSGTIYARVYTSYNGTLVYNDYTYTAP
jgi:hypothetical protein